jgi:glycosyltransferase involved in cell wall biosynthesis
MAEHHLVSLIRSDPTDLRYGGIRVARDLCAAVRQLGWEVTMVGPSKVRSVHVSNCEDGCRVVRVPYSAARLPVGLISRQPLQVSKRMPRGVDEVRRHLATIPGQRVVVIEQFPMYKWARALGRSDDIVVLRDHNDEPVYARSVRDAAAGLRRLALAYEYRSVSRLYREWGLRPPCDVRVRISESDQISNSLYVPPAVADPVSGAWRESVARTGPLRLGYFASLDSEQNIRDITRFLTDTWGLLRTSCDVTLLIGGRSPSRKLKAEIREAGAELLNEIPTPAVFYERVDVLVNPCLGGSGIAVKTLEGLAYGMPIVGTSGAFRGLGSQAAISEPPWIEVHTSNGLVDAIRALSESRDKVRTLARRARAFYESNFLPTAAARSFLAAALCTQ